MHRRWGRLRIHRPDFARLLLASDNWTASTPGEGIIGLVSVGRLHNSPGVVDLGVHVADHLHRRGIGTGLVRFAARHAMTGGAHTLSVYTEQANTPMLRLLRRLGPASRPGGGTHSELRLSLADVTSHPSSNLDEDFHAPTPRVRHA